MHPKNISIADFRYDLPADRIAHYPLAERDASKLLIYRDGEITEDLYRHISHHLPENSLLVFNNTKVVEARILFRKPTGAQIELFCLEPPPEYPGMAAAMMQTGKVRWKCLIGGASKWKPGQVLSKTIDGYTPVTLEARYITKLEDAFLVELSWQPADLSFAELLHQAGLIPLPPYIRRAADLSDSERYQTIYARHDGSVAAPTAGLHFTEAIFGSLATKHIQREFVTLHVGAGTFLPVKAATLEQHPMHVEFIAVARDTIQQFHDCLRGSDPGNDAISEQHSRSDHPARPPASLIIPVGTTSLRTIESLYWLGVKTLRDPAIAPENLVVHQWDAYEWPAANEPSAPLSVGAPEPHPAGKEPIDPISSRSISPSATAALAALLDWMDRQQLSQLVTRTQLLITPGYDMKIAGALVTNFHQPESTLLLLVAALIGEDWKKVYRFAMDHAFRFLSYGDGSLLFPARAPSMPPPSAGTPG